MSFISTCPSYWLRDVVPSGLPGEEFVLFYHPVDDLEEHTTGDSWVNYGMSFGDGVVGSGIYGSSLGDHIRASGAISPGADSVLCLSTVFWTSGFYGVDAGGVSGWVGLSDASGDEQNGILFGNDEVRLLVSGQVEAVWSSGSDVFGDASDFPLPSGEGDLNDWHLSSIAVSHHVESGNASGHWQCQVNYDGGEWLPLYPIVYSGSMAPTGCPVITTNLYPQIYVRPTVEGSGFCPAVDEVGFWGDTSFPSGVLTKIYDLGSGYGRPLDAYNDQYGIPNRPLLLSTIGGHQAMSTMWHSGNWDKRIK